MIKRSCEDPTIVYNATLIKVVPYKTERGEWRMELTCTYKAKDGKHEVTIPECEFPVNPNNLYIHEELDNTDYGALRPTYYLEGVRELRLFPATNPDRTHYVLTDKLVEPRVKEMTIAQIEKELGYKVKIVNEENKK